jgi:hypothetical protein
MTPIAPVRVKPMLCILIFHWVLTSTSRNLLLHKLSPFGLSDGSWFRCYLTNKQSRVRISGTLSLPFQITFGVPQGSVMGHFLFNVFINDISNSNKHCEVLIFADKLKIFRVINSSYDCLLLTPDINSMWDWCAANSVRRYIAKTRVILYSRKTNVLRYEYQLCHAAMTSVSNIKDLGASFESELYFHNHVDLLFCEYIKLLGLIRSIIFFNLHSGGWSLNWVHSARRPLTGLLYLPRVIVRMENLVE